MSGKKTKADLVALFKLEFYRKQNNWKFCTHVQKKKASVEKTKSRKTKPEVKSKNEEKCMNKTYHVATGERKNSLLDQAFVETEHDDNSPSSPNSSHSENDASPGPITRAVKNSRVDQKFPNHDPNLTGHIEKDEALNDRTFQKCANECEEIKKTTLIEDWLQRNVTQYNGLVYNQQNCKTAEQNQAESIEKYPQSKFQILRHLADICDAAEIKQQELNNNLEDFEKKLGIVPEAFHRYSLPVPTCPEPMLENWDEWKETHISMDTPHTARQSCSEVDLQSEIVWQDLPEIDKEGYEAPDVGWPFETQVWSNQGLFPDGVWSDSVVRSLRLLNVTDPEPSGAGRAPPDRWVPAPPDRWVPAPPDRWVPTDRLLQWMLVNKECCEDVLESSCESEETFMRGAHCAPHSSEADLQPQNIPGVDDMLESSCESQETFMRGAHCAPHSEALQLNLDATEGAVEQAGDVGALSPRAMSPRALSPRELSPRELSPRELSPRELSPRELRAAAREHARALARLAREIAGRERLQSDLRSRPSQPVSTGLRYDVSCEEYPTRDVGLLQPAFTDTFITGSYKNNPDNKQLDKQTDEQSDRKESEELIYLKDGRIVLRDSKSYGQTKLSRGQRKLSEPQMDIDWGQYGMEGDPTLDKPDQISVDKAQKELEARPYQIIQGIDQMNQERGQVVQERGRMVQERGQRVQERGQMNQERGQMVLNRGVISLDQGLEEPLMRSTSGFGEHNLLGRGRGRLHTQPLDTDSNVNYYNTIENNIAIGRGRGRLMDKI